MLDFFDLLVLAFLGGFALGAFLTFVVFLGVSKENAGQ